GHQRHTATLEFFVYLRPVGQLLRRALMKACRGEQPPLQFGVADLRRDRPRDPDYLGAAHVLGNRRLADARLLADLTDAEPLFMPELPPPEYLLISLSILSGKSRHRRLRALPRHRGAAEPLQGRRRHPHPGD